MFHVGARLKNARKARGLSQVQLANLIKADHSLISKIEGGHTTGSVMTLKNIAVALGVKVSYFLDDSPKAVGE